MQVLTAHVENNEGWSEVHVLVQEGDHKALIYMEHEWEDRDGDTNVLWSDNGWNEGDDLVDRIYAATNYDKLVETKLEANV